MVAQELLQLVIRDSKVEVAQEDLVGVLVAFGAFSARHF